VAALAKELPRHGMEPRILDPRRFPGRTTLSIHLGPDHGPKVETDLADLDDVRVGWFSSRDGVNLSAQTAPSARRFARAAATAGLLSLRQAHRFTWVNDPWAAGRSSDKTLQLIHARDRGLAVPETLLTNDPVAFTAFVRAKGQAAVKSPSGSTGLPGQLRVLTQRVTAADLADAESVRLAPVLAQDYVAKRTEVRATVVGSQVLAVEIHSQDHADTRIDWRRYHPGLRYDRIELPAAVRRGCVAVARDCGLAYSGIDLVRTPDDEYVFLEANSEPAWLWVEDETGLPITRRIAALLARTAKAKPGKERDH